MPKQKSKTSKKLLPGILPSQEIIKLIKEKKILSDSKEPALTELIQPASIDLSLGSVAYRLQSSFLPQKKTVRDKLKELSMYQIDLDKGGILEKGAVYLVQLNEHLDLSTHKDISGKANPKSSTGRLDVFTRVITDNCHRFDDISIGYKGALFLEIVPLSFTIKVQTGQTLNQLRLFRLPEHSVTKQEWLIATTEDKFHRYVKGLDLESLYKRENLLFNADRTFISNCAKHLTEDGLLMSVDLSSKKGQTDIVGYKAKKNSRIIDTRQIGKYNVEDFWEPIHSTQNGYLILEPEEFYIFASKEFIRVPRNYSAEMVEFDAGSGELRTHYAGFFDPGFGYDQKGETAGTKAVLEVRPHDVPFRIEDGQILFKMKYEKMTAKPDIWYGQEIGSNYHNQALRLSKQFRQD